MKHLLANRPSAPNNSLESEKKPDDAIELNRTRLSQSLINEKPDIRETKAGQSTQNIGTKKSQRLPQPSSPAPRLLLGKFIAQGAKWTVFSVVAIAITIMALYEPSPSQKEQQSESTNNPSQTLPIPPLEVPISASPEALPLPDTTTSQLSPQQGLAKQTLTPSQTSLDQPVAVNPSTDQIPSPKPELSNEPSLSGRDPVVPPTLPPNLPSLESPCAGQGTHQEASPVAANNKVNPDDNSPVVEVKNYFKKGWQSPAGLKQTLEYSVSINSDGTVQRIRPLSNASGEYIDQTNLPLPGSAFVSPREGGGNTNIYVAFSPDGKVKAALD
ncbi:hypothetical protein [Allocoleopsis franciscana]|uniref:Uncharacterized protein n=1 Tax=Allocoleopsis franciscana PCC 7113 TaxID=1173027 RepID=K9WHR6_9CYAN|nr:hypothetical protein [Allocoleopsis franciscana]AFZ19351.1 hypothetical protein Mic7113_3627 [Allocoleopsis franciscana PCC 7113]